MTKHGKVYLAATGLSIVDFIPSEILGDAACDLHHIECRGMGGTKREDRIENIIALTRGEHDKYGDKKHYMFYLYAKHFTYLKKNAVTFDESYMLAKMKMYQPFAKEYLEAVC